MQNNKTDPEDALPNGMTYIGGTEGISVYGIKLSELLSGSPAAGRPNSTEEQAHSTSSYTPDFVNTNAKPKPDQAPEKEPSNPEQTSKKEPSFAAFKPGFLNGKRF